MARDPFDTHEMDELRREIPGFRSYEDLIKEKVSLEQTIASLLNAEVDEEGDPLVFIDCDSNIMPGAADHLDEDDRRRLSRLLEQHRAVNRQIDSSGQPEPEDWPKEG